jgi:hypothetical protein
MSSTTSHSLQEALREFQASLTIEQNEQLQAIKTTPDSAAVLSFTAQLDEKNAQKKMGCVSGRLFTLLQSVQQFSTVVETFVSSNPRIAALVWGSVKVTMLVS